MRPTLLLASSAATAATPLERGKLYLVNAVLACDGCHTPRGPNGLDMSRRFSGGSQVWDTPAYQCGAPTWRRRGTTGIGGWSADDLKRALVDGVRPDGVPLAPQMPFGFYKTLTPADLDAVVAYLQSAPPVRNAVEAPDYRAEAPHTVDAAAEGQPAITRPG